MNLINKILIGLIALLVFLPMAFSVPQVTANIIQPNGSEYLKGTYTIKYTWNTTGVDNATGAVGGLSYFDPTNLNEPADIIVSGINLFDQANCANSDNDQKTPQNCTFVWNTKTAENGRFALRLIVYYFGQNDYINGLEETSDGTFIIDNVKPNAVNNLAAAFVDNNKVELKWSAVKDVESGTNNYLIYRSESEITAENASEHLLGQTYTSTKYVDSAINLGKTYFYRITVVDKAGNESNLSNQVTVNTTVPVPPAEPAPPEVPADTTKPTKITDLTLNATSDYFVLDWNNSTDASGIDYYKIYKSESEINSDNYTAAFLTKSELSYYVDNVVAVGKTYYYRVTAVDNSGNESELSNMVNAKVSAPAGTKLIEIIPAYEQINMGPNASASIIFGLKNLTPDKQCLTFSTEDNSPYIKETLSDTGFCINAFAQTTVTMNIITEYAQLSVYDVKFKLKIASTYEDFALVKVTVGQPASIDIVSTSGQQICKGNAENISFKVVNTTNEVKTIKLYAANEMFMPILSSNEVELDAKEEQIVNVKVYTNSSTSYGYHTLKIVGNIGAEYTEEILSFNVVDCSQPSNNALFQIIADTNTCAIANKEADTNINFQLKNLTAGKLTVNMQTFSAMETNVTKSIEIEPNSTVQLKVIVKPKLSDKTGAQNIELYGWSGVYDAKQVLCTNVQSKAKSSVELENNDLVIERKKQGIYVLTFKNLGDITENYEVKVNSPYSEMLTVNISDINFKLESKKEKEVFIAVSPKKDAALGDYTITAVTMEGETKSFDLRFKVIEETQMALDFYLFPSNVYIETGKDDVLTITLANESNTDLEGVKVYLKGLPSGVFAPIFEDNSIAKGKTKEFKMKLSVDKDVDPDLYQIKLIAEKGNEKTEETIWLKVKSETVNAQPNVTVKTQDNGLLGGLSGFVGFASSFTLGAILVALVIILAILLFYVRKKEGSDVDEI